MQTFFGYVSNDVQSLQEKFEYIINATEKLDQRLFQNNPPEEVESNGDEQQATQADYSQVINNYFKYPIFFLSTGTAIRLPIVNSIKEHEIGISLVVHFSDIVSRIIGNKELMGEMELQSQQFIHVMLESLVNIVDCLIVEYPVIPTLSSFNFRYGMMDGIIEFMSKIPFVNEPFIIMFNKI